MPTPPLPDLSDIDVRAGRFARRGVVWGLASGLGLGLAISSGLIAERLRAGSLRPAILIDVVVLGISVVVMTLTSRPLNLRFIALAEHAAPAAMRLRSAAVLVPQLLGAVAGMALAHVFFQHSRSDALAWMCECAPQFVNDAVAVGGVLAAIWGCAARRIDVVALVGMFALLIAYGATQSHWHVDRAPFVFASSIQEIVVAQVVAVATGLLAFRRFSAG